MIFAGSMSLVVSRDVCAVQSSATAPSPMHWGKWTGLGIMDGVENSQSGCDAAERSIVNVRATMRK